MKYLQSNIDIMLRLQANKPLKAKWWIDASYAVHSNMKSHTGGVLMVGKEAEYSTLTRQKLMTRSSTKAKLVGVHNVLPQIIWSRNFMEMQGFDMGPSIVYQDN